MNILNRKIPTIFGLAVLIIGIGLAIFVLNNTTSLESQAAPEDEPKNIRISDVGANSLSISFTTDTAVLSSIRYGTSETALSQSTTSGNVESTTHLITLNNLSPSSQYYFMIISGTHEYSDNGVPFVTSTGPGVTGEKSPRREISGTISSPDGTPAGGALVYLTTTGANVLAKKANTDGVFSFEASDLLTSDFSSYFQVNDETILNINASLDGQDLTAAFLASAGNPLPNTTLGQTYNFLASEEPEASLSAEVIGFPVFRERATEEGTISIESPEANEGFSDQKPNFQGTALPNETVEITIQSSHEIQTTVTANENGDWEYRPETDLDPGEHTLTIKTRDENGILRILTRPFTVYAQGSQFTEPSVSPTEPTPTNFPTSSPTPTALPSVSPEVTASPTATIIPTQTPVPSEITPTPVPSVDPTGPTDIPLVIISSVAFLMGGAIIYLIARMKSL